jgi:uncharacterized protein (TIGR00730 family)
MNNQQPKKIKRRNFTTAREELQAKRTAPLTSRYVGENSAYEFAYADNEFLTRRELRGARLQLEYLKPDLIQRELGIHNTIVVFGSARFKAPEDAVTAQDKRMAHYYQEAQTFGKLVAEFSAVQDAEDKLYVCTGGGPGIMEAANRGAHEAGQATVGMNISLPHEQEPNAYITPALCFQFHYFAIRKMHFMMRARALVAFPGGFGTMDELFETLTLIQTRKSERVPIILFNEQWWKKLVNFDFLVEEGTISQEDLSLVQYAENAADCWALIKQYYQLS